MNTLYINKLKRLAIKAILIALPLGGSLVGVSCVDNDDEGTNYYTATKRTAAQLLSDDPDRYSEFQAILERANYYSLLSTYGTYTVFAPTNDAINQYLKETGYGTVENIPLVQCDTLARTHIVNKGAYFTTDYSDGTLPQMNMDDRYIVITSDSDVANNNQLLLYVNKNSKIIEKDDSVTNGVVHTIDRVLAASNLFVPDLIENDSTLTIFSDALKLTNMCDSLTKYLDDSYRCEDDSVTKGVDKHYGGSDWKAKYPEKRFFKYTALVEPDTVFHANNIRDVKDLAKYAKEVYDKVYPEDAGLYDDDYTNRKNPLNRFVSYHLLDRQINYDDLAPSGTVLTQCLRTDVADAEAFWQTMCPGQMIRFCRPNGELYANRKGFKKNYVAGCKGVKVLSASESGKAEQLALNGTYHYLDNILVYDTNVRDRVLNCRMRIDATTLSPDFWNAGAVAHGSDILTSFKNGYIGNWKTTKETYIGVRSENVYMSSYLANAICVLGQYDVQIKIPTPPPGLYEVRLGYVAGEDRGVVQVYFGSSTDGKVSYEPCGIPVDLRFGAWGTEVGYEADTDDEEHNTANDKAMRNRGYMKAMDSYGKPGATNFRVDSPEHLRRILTTQQFREGGEYWLRFRQVLDGDREWSFDYIELCPKSIYASPDGEDKH